MPGPLLPCRRCHVRSEVPGAAHLSVVLLDWLLSDDAGAASEDQVPLGHWMRHCCGECGRHLNLVTGSAAVLLATLVLLPALTWLG